MYKNSYIPMNKTAIPIKTDNLHSYLIIPILESFLKKIKVNIR